MQPNVLEHNIHEHIPLSKAMAVSVVAAGPEDEVLRAYGGDRVDRDQVYELKIKSPYVEKNQNYRRGARVNNIRMRIWPLLRHVRG